MNKKYLPPAIICDLDNTLALFNGRGGYEYNKCDTDIVNKPILNLIWQTTGTTTHLIFVTGREDYCREKTINWIKKALGRPQMFDLYMRKTGDFRPGTIVKKEIYEKYIKDKYEIEFALEDKPEITKMWRDLGITCLQVADGED